MKNKQNKEKKNISLLRWKNTVFVSTVSLILCCMIGCGRVMEEETFEPPVAVEVQELESTQAIEASDTIEESIEETIQKKDESNNSNELELDDPAEESEKSQEEPIEESSDELPDSSITLIMVGDVLMHTPVTESGLAEDGTYHYEHLFANVKDLIRDADIAMVNQEVILGGTALGLSGYPAFNAPFEVGDALADAGFDVVLHATNHALDKGEKGIRNCLGFWQECYPEMKIAGIYGDQESYNNGVIFIEQDGIKIAILNYTYGTNGIPLPKDAPYLVNLLDRAKIASDVEKAKQEADFVVLCPHWGTEYRHDPDESQKEWARYFADLDVDLVIGAHPHVIEPVEWVDDTLVYYSLGNFVNATSGTGNGVADRMLGSMAVVHITKEDDKVKISGYESIPLVSHLEHGYGNITVYPMEEYTTELASKNWIVEQDGNFSLEYLQNLWSRVMERRR